MSQETHAFQTEVVQLLDLMIHSLYSHKEVFLRELVSNASDALDRVRFAGLTDASLLPDAELAIELRVDPEARTLAVSDSGIGMSREEVLANLGTIARSGTAEFLARMRDAQGGEVAPDLIGQFGVGFYASFMAADEVTVLTRKAGETGATRWHSQADGRFTVEDAEREGTGTTVTLKLKAAEPEAGLEDFTSEWVLREVVRKYSDFVAYPIRLVVEGRDEQPDEPLNSMKAIWTRPKEEVSEEEHKEFYRHVSHDFHDPLLRVQTKIEGTFEANALLYVPSVAPFDLYHRERSRQGIQLYVKRVFIMDEAKELLPEYLRFVKGVVDAEDVSLNVSREMLQQDPQVRAIRRHLTKKVLESLGELQRDEPEKYREFWAQLGPVLKEGLLDPSEKPERIFDLMRVSTSEHEAGVSLAEVVDAIPEEREVIYYLAGLSPAAVAGSPQLEAFRARGIEVVLFDDPVDEIWLEQGAPAYRDKRWQSVAKGELDLDPTPGEGADAKEADGASGEGADEGAYGDLLSALRSAVQDDVKEVRLSRRLTESPACLVRDEGDLSPQIEAMLRQAGQEVPVSKPILELNPAHPLLVRLRELHAENGTDPRVREAGELLLGQAILADGGAPADPAAFARKLADWMVRAL